uniref:Major facilitator superfamily (MFS) profile domain-containing protein n=1 Tax=Megaselia scalaris TaxID=36166 RepID=T1GIF1_MEGSC
MSMIEASVYIGLAFGSISASFLFPMIGAKYLFVLSASIIVFASLYIMLFVKESLNEDQISTNFNHFGAIPIIKAALQRRRSYDRLILWLLISIYVMNVIVIDGQGAIFYIYLRGKFQLTVSEYTKFEFYSIILPVIILYALKYQSKTFSALSLALVSYGSQILRSVADATANNYVYIIVGLFLGSLKLFALPMVRVMISLVVPPQEFTKIIAITNILGNFLPFVAAPIYTFVYTNTFNLYSGAVIFLSTGFFSLCFLFLCAIFIITRRNEQHYTKFFENVCFNCI